MANWPAIPISVSRKSTRRELPPEAFADEISWGYQLVGRLDYNNAFKGVNMSPLVVFAHDVHRWVASFLSALEDPGPSFPPAARPAGAFVR